ncbi:NAD-dependent epimerase/dehydratase family protein [Amycolatopsis sp. cmx-4-68]|uniref:NAD-dependent epimerase/dehydratase family protein n=1 Tax=Amycolatopsis sp. cmx-4-68 TaxID=2790938 RepID=UPI00397A2078
MRVLVTGGAGFIGTRVVAALLTAGHEVKVLDALLPSVHSGPPDLPPDVEFVEGDIRDDDVLRSALRGVDAVSHHAAMVGRGREIRDVADFSSCNDLGTAKLIVAMTEAGVDRLIHASSVAVYGEGRYRCAEHGRVRPGRRLVADLEAGSFEPRCPECHQAELTAEPIEETDFVAPVYSVYAGTKATQEHLVAAWATETRCSAVALRYFCVYGPDMPFDSPYTGVAGIFRSDVIAGRSPRVYEDGCSLRDYIHVTDVAAANVAALGRDDPGFRTYNVSGGRPHTVHEVATTLSTEVGGPSPIVTGEFRAADARHVFGSPARLMRELNWRPTVDFASGMREFAVAPMRERATPPGGLPAPSRF